MCQVYRQVSKAGRRPLALVTAGVAGRRDRDLGGTPRKQGKLRAKRGSIQAQDLGGKDRVESVSRPIAASHASAAIDTFRRECLGSIRRRPRDVSRQPESQTSTYEASYTPRSPASLHVGDFSASPRAS